MIRLCFVAFVQDLTLQDQPLRLRPGKGHWMTQMQTL